MRSEMVLYTAGRVGATDALNLDACGLAADDRGRLKVDPQTLPDQVPHIYAPATRSAFRASPRPRWSKAASPPATPSASRAPNAPEFFPYGIYSVPEISTVGMSEQEVRERGIPYECGVARFRETSRGHIMGLKPA